MGGPLVLTAAKARGILLVWQLVFMDLIFFFLKAGFILSCTQCIDIYVGGLLSFAILLLLMTLIESVGLMTSVHPKL